MTTMTTSTAPRTSVGTQSSADHESDAERKKRRQVRYRAAASALMLTLGLAIGAASIVSLVLGLSALIGNIETIDAGTSQALGVAGLFVAASLIVARLLATAGTGPAPETPKPIEIHWTDGKPVVLGADVNDVLMREFEYGRETAGQAMEERRTVLNFYLLIFGGAGSAAVAFLPNIAAHSELVFGAVLLFWLVNLIGWLALFQIIALRRAWVGSVLAMSYIKEFYLSAAAAHLSADSLEKAFHFKARSIPAAEKRWNTNHYSAILVGLLDAAAFWAGATLMGYGFTHAEPVTIVLGNTALACVIFVAHWWSYDIGLIAKLKKAGETNDKASGKGK